MKRLVALVVCAALNGCATYRVQVQASRARPAPITDRTYTLDLTAAAPNAHARQFGPARRALETALAHRGFRVADTPDGASVVVSFNYEVDAAGMETWHRSVSRDVSRGPILPGGTSRVQPPPPTREVTLVQQNERRYRISLLIEARDAKSRVELWRVQTAAFIGAADRDAILPCLIAAAEPVLDPPANTAGEVAIGHQSAEVRALRRGL